jgi:regulatory protein
MPAGTVTALKVQQRSKERVNVFLDGAYAFSLEAVAAAGLRVGQALSEAEVRALQETDSVAQAVNKAASFLAYRPRSTAEVRRNLARKDYPEAVIDAAVARLTALGYLDDEAFAAYWIDNRTQFKPLGERALRYELRQHGVPAAIIEDAVQRVDAAASAYSAAASQRRKLRGSDRPTFRAKASAFLQRRGFNHDTISEVLGRLITEIEAEDPDYFAETD